MKFAVFVEGSVGQKPTPTHKTIHLRTLLCLSVQFYSERIEIFELERTYPFSDIIRESSNIPRELSSGKFLLINFARSKYFGGEFCLTDKKQFFSDFVLEILMGM